MLAIAPCRLARLKLRLDTDNVADWWEGLDIGDGVIGLGLGVEEGTEVGDGEGT